MSVRLSVRKRQGGGNVIFAAPIKDRQLKYLVKIPMAICSSTLYTVLFSCLLIGVLDRFLHFYIFVIFSSPPDRRQNFNGIK